MKTTKKILTMLLTLAMICALLAACGTDNPGNSTTGSNGGEGNNLGIDSVDPIEGDDTFIARNPDTDPPIDSPDGSEVDTFDEVETATIENAVVVRATKNEETDRINFSCAAVIEGYGGEYTPFTFGVPTSVIDGEYDPEKPEDLTGAIVNIDFDGVFMESYPLQIGGVTKVSITDERADDATLNECKASFDIEDSIEQDTFDETDTSTIENAVVVSANKHADSERIGFSCAAILKGYPGEYYPFEFDVPISAIEGEYDIEKLRDLIGAIVNIDFNGFFLESDPLQISGVTKVSITDERADDATLNECEAGFGVRSCIVDGMYICEGWIVKAEPASDDSGNAVIYAMVQLGTCGLKDFAKLSYPADRIRDEAGETVDIESIAPGTCFEFAYNGNTTVSDDGKAIFEILREDMDYVTIGSENVGYTAEQYAEFEAYFETEE